MKERQTYEYQTFTHNKEHRTERQLDYLNMRKPI